MGRHKQNTPYIAHREPMKIGYARVSTTKQDLSVQKDLLKKAGCDFIVSEKVSGGAAIEERRELFTLLDSLIEGDELVIYDLSRLSRQDSQEAMILLWQIRAKGVRVTALDGKLNLDDDWGDVIAMILTKVANLEKAKIKERTRAGRIRAMENGVKFGAKPKIGDAEKQVIVSLYKDGKSYAQIAEILKIHKSSVGRIMSELIKDGRVSKR